MASGPSAGEEGQEVGHVALGHGQQGAAEDRAVRVLKIGLGDALVQQSALPLRLPLRLLLLLRRGRLCRVRLLELRVAVGSPPSVLAG
eukprot:4474993-Pyramimonas_sp.AAC.1